MVLDSAQATSHVGVQDVEMEFQHFSACANDGQGERLIGTCTVRDKDLDGDNRKNNKNSNLRNGNNRNIGSNSNDKDRRNNDEQFHLPEEMILRDCVVRGRDSGRKYTVRLDSDDDIEQVSLNKLQYVNEQDLLIVQHTYTHKLVITEDEDGNAFDTTAWIETEATVHERDLNQDALITIESQTVTWVDGDMC